MEEQAFLSAIYRNPEDPTPYLIFADWLEEHGKPAGARYFRELVEKGLPSGESEFKRGQRLAHGRD